MVLMPSATLPGKSSLGRDWELVLDGSQALILRRSDRVPVASLDGSEAVVLGLLDGTHTDIEVAATLDAALGHGAAQYLGYVKARLGPLLEQGVERRYPFALDRLAQAKRLARGKMRLLPGPRILHWWVTSACPRRCAYCFANPELRSDAYDAVVPRPRLRTLFEEAASLGADTLLVAGAEPLLRPDLPEVLGDAIQAGLTPVMTTKHRISWALAERLAQAGLNHISMSLDSLKDDVNAILVGARSYAAQVMRNAEHLRAHGVRFSFQAVVTSLDPHGWRDVVDYAARAGAMVVQVVPFEPVLRPIAGLSNESMRGPSASELRREVETTNQGYPALRVELFQEIGSDGRGSGLECDIGSTKLFFLPNGVVHRCYKLVHDRSLDGADMRRVSLAEAWHDPNFGPILEPPREAYAESECHTCERFDTCHSEGRCIYHAHVRHGAYARPDRYCTKARNRHLTVVG